jgi:hypothetical protein
MAIAHLVADFEMFTFNAWRRGRFLVGNGQQARVNGTAGSHRSCDYVFDEVAA